MKGILLLVITLLLFIVLTVISNKNKKYSFEKELLKCESPIETAMMKKLHQAGYKPYSQIPCGKYRIDIALYGSGKKIAIECDGEEFHSSIHQKAHDQKKDYFLEKSKWRVFRFTGKEIFHTADQCVEAVKKHL